MLLDICNHQINITIISKITEIIIFYYYISYSISYKNSHTYLFSPNTKNFNNNSFPYLSVIQFIYINITLRQ